MNTLKLYLVLIGLLLGVSAWAANSNPNILFIYLDDLGYGDVTCYNLNSKIHTPNIDRLAKEGMAFTDAHTPAAICGPSRYGLMTGRYPWRRGEGGYWQREEIQRCIYREGPHNGSVLVEEKGLPLRSNREVGYPA